MPRLAFRPLTAGLWDDILATPRPPIWIRALAGKSGVYVIRSRTTKRTLYVGESHTGRLKKTLLRHFQAWSGKTSGPTYGRADVEVAVVPTPAAAAVARQNALICQLDPKDNTNARNCPDPEPF